MPDEYWSMDCKRFHEIYLLHRAWGKTTEPKPFTSAYYALGELINAVIASGLYCVRCSCYPERGSAAFLAGCHFLLLIKGVLLTKDEPTMAEEVEDIRDEYAEGVKSEGTALL